MDERNSNLDVLRERLDEARRESSRSLDLGDLSLTALPEGLATLDSLEVLSLGWTPLGPFDSPTDEPQPLRNDSSFSHLGELSPLARLARLSCDWNQSLSDISGIGKLDRLEFVNLSGCRNLTDIGILRNLGRLRELHFRDSTLGELPPLRGAAIECLNLSGSEQLSGIHEIGNLSNLRRLELCECAAIEGFEVLQQCGTLTSLRLDSNPAVDDLFWLKGIRGLEHLSLANNPGLQGTSFLRGLNKLRSLNLGGCEALGDPRGISSLSSLEHLSLRGLQDVSDLRTLKGLRSLTHLDLGHCSTLSNFSVLRRLKSLTHLSLCHCESFVDTSILSGLVNLVSLDLSGCTNIVDISPLRSLGRLECLRLDGCANLSDFSALGELRSLRELGLSGCDLKDASALSELQSLVKLDIDYCESLRDVESLSDLTMLDRLDSKGCSCLERLSGLGKQTKLRRLNFSKCVALRDISALSSLKNLLTLDFEGCKELEDVSALLGLTKISDLNLCGSSVADLSALSKMDSMYRLQLSEGKADLAPICNLSSLVELKNVDSCSQSFSRLAEISTLKELQVVDPENMSALPKRTGLEDLWLNAMSSLENLNCLSGLSNLKTLHVFNGFSLESVAGLSDLTNLRKLSFMNCRGLSDLSGLEGLHDLTHINFYGCSITDLSPLLPIVRNLDELTVENNEEKLEGLPLEVLEHKNGDARFNLAPSLSSYVSALEEQGSERWRQCKVIVLGNGRVGKTSVVNAIKGDPHCEDEKSTHGIRHREARWPVFDELNCEPVEVNLRFWDFGGQDLFHNTHRLFMRSRAVFVIVWSGGQNLLASEEPQRPLQYWIDQVFSLNPKAEVIIVRNKGDLEEEVQGDLAFEWKHQLKEEYHQITAIDFSARNWSSDERWGQHRDQLRLWIGQASLRVLGNSERTMIGQGQLRVIEELQGSIAQRKILTRTEFDELVRLFIPGSSDAENPEFFLDFLHHAGVVFVDPERIPNMIIVDQEWALAGIYTLFDRSRCRDHLKLQGGRFTPAQLRNWTWDEAGYSNDHQELFIGLMESCGIAALLLSSSETKSGERLFIVPQYVGHFEVYRLQVEQRLAQWGEPTFQFPDCEDHYLGSDAILNLLIRIVRVFGRRAVIWKYGAFFESSSSASPSAAFLEWNQKDNRGYGGKLIAKIYGDPEEMKLVLANEFGRVGVDQAPMDQPDEGINPMSFESVPPSAKEKAMPRLTFSVSGTDSAQPSIRKCSDALLEYVTREMGERVEIIHYRDDTSRTSMGDLMDCIASGDLIVIVMGRRYLQSPYCMLELELTRRGGRSSRSFRRQRKSSRNLSASKREAIESGEAIGCF